MTIVVLCDAPYQRPDGSVLSCHYLPGHPVSRHSWWTASVNDREGVIGVLEEIHNGKLDPYLEAILAAAHSRKRMLRGRVI